MRFLFFHGLAGFCGAWLEGTGYLPRKAGRILDKEFRRQFQDSSWRDQMYWNSAQLLRPELWHQITRPLTATSVLKLNSLSLFPLTKRVARILKPEVAIIWPLSSSSPCQAIHSDYYTDLCPSSLSTRVRLRSTDSLTYILISTFNGQPLGPVNSNTEGIGENFLFLSSQW